MKKMRGTTGIDEINGTRNADLIFGFGGNDLINGGAGNDKLKGGEGSDYVYGASGRDRIWGDGDDDFLFGDGGNDTINGGLGNDVIVGGSGADTLVGGAGNDRLFSNIGNDKMNGGTGDDYYGIGKGRVQTTDASGNDSYALLADSSLTIDDRDGNDKLYFADVDANRTITLNDLFFAREGDDLIITIDGYQGATTISFFFAEEAYRIERLYDEDKEHKTGYSLEEEWILNLSNGDSPVRGSDIWEF
ncbi:calcium-binding protein [Rhizobium sp.]